MLAKLDLLFCSNLNSTLARILFGTLMFSLFLLLPREIEIFLFVPSNKDIFPEKVPFLLRINFYSPLLEQASRLETLLTLGLIDFV